jgi:hypothetical protein
MQHKENEEREVFSLINSQVPKGLIGTSYAPKGEAMSIETNALPLSYDESYPIDGNRTRNRRFRLIGTHYASKKSWRGV